MSLQAHMRGPWLSAHAAPGLSTLTLQATVRWGAALPLWDVRQHPALYPPVQGDALLMP